MRIKSTATKARHRLRSIIANAASIFCERLSSLSSAILRRFRVLPTAETVHATGFFPVHFDYYCHIPDDIPSVNELLEMIPDEKQVVLDELESMDSCEVFLEGEPKWRDVPAQFVTLPIGVVHGAGIGGPSKVDIVLYIRERCYQQLKFIEEFVIRQGRIGRIHGHPGTGKSVTALYFAIHMVAKKKWNVLWVHLTKGRFMCLHMKPDGSVYRTKVKRSDMLDSIIENFHQSAESWCLGHLILIDGLDGMTTSASQTANDWFDDDPKNRRLVLLSSDGMDNDLNDQDAEVGDEAIFRQWSWKLHEYKMAMSNNVFRFSVERFMDAVGDPLQDSDKTDAKFFYAGGCARYMFGKVTMNVKTRIDKAVRKQLQDVRSVGAKTHFDLGSVHSLFSFFGGHTFEIVSKYAEEELVRHCGSEELICLARHRMIQQIPRTIGLLFESFVKHRAYQENQIDMIEYDSKGNGNPTRWIINGVEDFAPDTLTRDNCPLDTLMWPLSDQEPTIDALILTEKIVNNVPKRVVLFIQITIAEKHRADMLVLKNHMTKLEADVAEFYFVLPPEPRSRVSKFTVSPIANTKAMVLHDWPESAQEIRSKVQVVTFPGWNV